MVAETEAVVVIGAMGDIKSSNIHGSLEKKGNKKKKGKKKTEAAAKPRGGGKK